jgi:hypothetical protein
MLSIRELIVLAVVVFVVWYGYRVYARVDAARVRRRKSDRSRAENAGTPELDLVKCRVCDAYVSEPASGRCDRSDCPR